MYVLITRAEREDGNMAASMGDALSIATGLLPNEPSSYSSQVFRTGEIVLQDERCCPVGRKYWRWRIKYEEGFETIEEAKKRAEELGIPAIVHDHC